MEGKNINLKICGIRSIEEIEELKSLDIDYFGCIFAKSPRKVSTELAKKITEIAHKAGKKTVGVFVNENIENILEIVAKTGIDCVQLHGIETPEYCLELLQKFDKINDKCGKKIKIWKAFPVKDKLPDIEPYLKYIEYPLFDAKGENRGGNGITFDWNILKDLKGQKFILAGGLSKENIANALEYSPIILDVNSRVEVGDRKNKGLVEEIINLIGGDIFE
nr:phosphoribosylanthranilate isomerase [uncultured Leptotrichia sp.]